MTEQRSRSWWGWGWAEAALPDAECIALAGQLPGLRATPVTPPDVAHLDLRPPRIAPPPSFAAFTSAARGERASHAYGKAYRDVVRALTGDVTSAPDFVAYPQNESDVIDLLDWAAGNDTVVIPYGAGSSVVGGVEYRGDPMRAVVSLDLSAMDRVLEVDRTSRASRIQAGARGPILEDQLRPDGLTLRHFPQSFEFSTLGGWLATRAGGHYATLFTHIDDFVESMRVVTPVGVSESWRLPGSGAGPSPDRMFLGSEGILGVITEAWMRLQDRPDHRASRSVAFTDLAAALGAVRTIAQSGLHPSNCRLLDPGEAMLSGASTDGSCVLVLGFESAHGPVDAALADVLAIAQQHGGIPNEERGAGGGAVDSWRNAFLRMPYVRDGMARMGAIVETFETATTWDRIDQLIADVRTEVGQAIEKVTGAPGLVNCRLTHVYPDGAAPYFTVIAAGKPGSELAMWDDLKAAATEVLTSHQATITHHHAVGRDHRPGYDQQRPEPFAVALRAAKKALDPQGILNPGVLIN